MTTPFEKKLLAGLKLCGVNRGARIVLGVSGGADSIAMLDGMSKSKRCSLIVAHLNHCLRGEESDADEEFVRSEAAKLNLPFQSERAEVGLRASETGRNVEAVAREERYDFLARVAQAHDAAFVATAHTRDDQVETILLRLIRGAAPRGLRGIYEQRTLVSGVTLIRPMLKVTHDEVHAYCAHHNIPFRTDSSNLSLQLSRNRVRQDLLPRLRSLNPEFDEALLRTACLIGEDSRYLDALAGEIAKNAMRDATLDATMVAALDVALRRRITRIWLEMSRGNLLRIDKAHLDAIDGLIIRRVGGKEVELPGGWRVRSEHGRLQISKFESKLKVH